MISFDDFLGVKRGLPEQLAQAVGVFEILLSMVDDPDVELRLLVNDLLNIKDQIAHTLTTSHLLVEIGLQVIDACYLFIELRQLAWNLLNQMVVHLYLLLHFLFLLEQPNDCVLRLGYKSHLFIAFWFSISKIRKVNKTQIIVHVDVFIKLLLHELLVAHHRRLIETTLFKALIDFLLILLN